MVKYLKTTWPELYRGSSNMDDNDNIAEIINKSIFLLGAGFSIDAGLLTSVQMFDDLKKRILDENDSFFSPVEKEALKFMISCLKYHSEWRTMEAANNFTFAPNIEELALLIRRVNNRENFLPYPITGNWADKLVQLEAEFSSEMDSSSNLFESIEFKIRKLLKDEWLNISKDNDLRYLNPLSDFFKAYPKEEFKLDIFTLNYDTVIENYFKGEHDIPWRGFSNGHWSSVLPDSVNDPYGRINLYKLHGSIDWTRLEDMDTCEISKIGDDQAANIEEKHNPYIIFGQGTKSFSIEPFFSLIHHFNACINNQNKKYIFVIGYSFFDPYINNLIFNAVKGFKKLIIVNPSFGPGNMFEHDEKEWWKVKSNPDNYFLAMYKDGYNKGNLTDFMREIQKNSFYSELPEFNYLAISAENVEYIPLKTAEFIERFFADGGDLYRKYISEFEKQSEEEEPF